MHRLTGVEEIALCPSFDRVGSFHMQAEVSPARDRRNCWRLDEVSRYGGDGQAGLLSLKVSLNLDPVVAPH
jgi:hypothetical protein